MKPFRLLVVSALLLPALSAAGQPPPELVTLRGRVIDAKTKQPVPGAIAALRLPDKEARFNRILPIPTMNAAPTDERGAFAFEGIPEGEYQLLVAPAGPYHPFSQQVSVPAAEPAVLEVLLTPLNVITGTLLKPDGAVAAKSDAYVTMQWGGDPYKTGCQTDAQGRYRLPFRAAGAHRLLVRVLGVGNAYCEVTTKAGEDSTLDVRLQPSASVSGAVKDKFTDRPVDGIQVSFHPIAESGSAASLPPHPTIAVTTGSEGKFSLPDVPAGSWSLQFEGKPILSYDPARVSLQGGQKGDIRITVTPAPRVTVTLLGAEGRRLATAQNVALEIWTRLSDGKWSTDSRQMTADAQGQLSTNVGQVGETQLRVFVEGEGYGFSPRTKVEAGKDLECQIRLRPFRRVAGVVLEKGTNRPVAGATVKAEPVDEGQPPTGRHAESACDNAGRFVLENVVPSTYDVSIAAGGFTSPSPLRVAVPEEGTTTEITIELERATTTK